MALSSAAVRSVQPLCGHITADYPPPALQRTYSRNIMNLEQMAEDISQGGSDIGEEIRRMNEEQKQRSRQSSIQSSHQGEGSRTRGGSNDTLGLVQMDSRDSDGRGRASSNGLADATREARWGGYSPNRFMPSSVGPARSGSGRSQPSLPRKPSATSSSRLAQMIEPVQEGKPLDSPLAPGGSLYSTSPPEEHDPSRQISQSSFSRHYDQIAGQIQESLEHVPQSGMQDGQGRGTTTPPMRPRSTDTFQEAQTAFKDFDGVHFSPNTDEFVEVDEHGNEVRRISARNSSGGLSVSAASMLRTPRARPISYAEPPPADGMVYYPAPVPRMLNLPKRLSQLPAAKVQAKRRTQVLSQIDPDVIHAAPWIPQMDFDKRDEAKPKRPSGGHSRESSGSHPDQPPRPYLNERMSVANMQHLPPQLRASVFFDQQSVTHDVQVKNESAVATLDSILAASATAPVTAFTDHPFAGDVRRSTFAPEIARARRSTTLGEDMSETARPGLTKRRSSLGNLLRRASSGNDLAEQLDRRGSRSSLLLDFNEGGRKLQKRKSQMSLGDEVKRQGGEEVYSPSKEVSDADLAAGLSAAAHNRDAEAEPNGSRPVTAASWNNDRDGTQQQIDEDFKEQEAGDDVDEDAEPQFVQPSTLLAELQVRKANQKSRNRTAATHYPNGMHSTLLQLDAVEQISKAKRQRQRIPLAWEGAIEPQEERVDEDDEVPLGVLFPVKEQRKKRMGEVEGFAAGRPMGLMEKREMEDNEPLALRRNRMLGLPAGFGRAEREVRRGLVPTFSRVDLLGGQQQQLQQQQQQGDELVGAEEGEEGETLGDRLRKLKTQDALATAVSDVLPKDGSKPVSTFADDVLGQFGGAEETKEESSRPGTQGKDVALPVDAEEAAEAGANQEEETLGQRRARLQREIEEDEDVPLATIAQRPEMQRAGSSFANLLAAHPVGARKASKEHKAAEGTLLHASALLQAKQKQQLASTNIRSASFYGLDRPLVDAGSRPQSARNASGLLGGGNIGAKAPAGGFAGGLYNNGLGGVGMSGPSQGIQTSASTPLFGAGGGQQRGGYFPSPTMGFSPGMQQQGLMAPPTYRPGGLPVGGSMTSYGFPAMAVSGYGAPPQMAMPMQMPYAGGMGSGMPMGAGGGFSMGMMEDPMDAGKRAGIDQWRSSVHH
ncbi:hypothetical protein LTR97_001121 [Elasticomyces elasticus]|uniref:Uncharacterized protein n=1 Tax=Elasticomyces elasticus TaxID=574655 RepID=A0AAN7ZVT0_9PEZI|nr:hypothetical protein LTR97_001121 [Elasticomyces elasticus]